MVGRSSDLRPGWRRGRAGCHLTFHVAPFFRLSQRGEEVLKGRRVRRRMLKPSQEVERLAEITALVKPAGDGRKVAQPRGDVPGAGKKVGRSSWASAHQAAFLVMRSHAAPVDGSEKSG